MSTSSESPDRSSGHAREGGLSAAQARTVELSIIALCIVAIVLIFQPWSLTLYGVGAGLVVLGGLLFNLVPLCRPGATWGGLAKAAAIVFAILFTVIVLAIGGVHLYGLYLKG